MRHYLRWTGRFSLEQSVETQTLYEFDFLLDGRPYQHLSFLREWEVEYLSQQVTENYTLTSGKHKIKAHISPKTTFSMLFGVMIDLN